MGQGITRRRLLVIGARWGSLGRHVVNEALPLGWDVRTAGINEEAWHIDVRESPEELFDAFDTDEPFDAVVCTAGINKGDSRMDFSGGLEEHMAVNFLGVMKVLWAWAAVWEGRMDDLPEGACPAFVAVSSNSAHVARSASLGYCASKAALSMGIRCAARRAGDGRLSIYGYEFGWLKDTPMSMDVEDRLSGGPRHRIPGDRTLDPGVAARLIMQGLEVPGPLNGCMIRIDGGEQ